jgi:hypothetical protein
MFACNLFGVDRTGLLSKNQKKNQNKAEAIEEVSMINQVGKTMPGLVARNHITY